jgi:hypothetical protein
MALIGWEGNSVRVGRSFYHLVETPNLGITTPRLAPRTQ